MNFSFLKTDRLYDPQIQSSDLHSLSEDIFDWFSIQVERFNSSMKEFKENQGGLANLPIGYRISPLTQQDEQVEISSVNDGFYY